MAERRRAFGAKPRTPRVRATPVSELGRDESGVLTAIEPGKRAGRFNLYVDGRFALSLDEETLASARLKSGDEVTGARLAALAAETERRRALDSALRVLGVRPRSQRELEERLGRRGYSRPAIDAAVSRVRELGYVDDEAFARYWTEQRGGTRPKSARMIQRELQTKGVDREVSAEAVAEVDDLDHARRAATARARSLGSVDAITFRNRLGSFLARRGFGGDVMRTVISELLAERGDDGDELLLKLDD